MTDDTSAIPSSGCNVLTNSETLYNYSSGVRKTFRQVGGKWIQTEHTSFQTLPSQYDCISVAELRSYSVYEPILYFISFVLFLVAVYLFFYCIRKLFYAIRV